MIRKKIIPVAVSTMLMISSFTLTGCFGNNETESYSYITQEDYNVPIGAETLMCNGSLRMTFTNIQRRPTSIFSGASVDSNGLSGAEASTVTSVAVSTDVAIQIDCSYTYNTNTYQAAVASSSSPSTLNEILTPGTLMYIQGEDENGEKYFSDDVIIPTAETTISSLSTNSKWDYDILNSALPETSVTKTGSFIFRVTSTATNLRLVIYSPSDGTDVSNAEDVLAGSHDTFTLKLT